MPEAFAVPTPGWLDDPEVATLGRIVQLEARIEQLLGVLRQQQREIAEIRAEQNPSERRAQERDMRLFEQKVLARILRVHPNTVKNWREAGLIESVILPSGNVRFSGQQIRTFIEKQTKRSKSFIKNAA